MQYEWMQPGFMIPGRSSDLGHSHSPKEGSGYRHAMYAASFSEFAKPLHLPLSNGWLLARKISGTDHWDAMGSYPLFCCDDWSQVESDLVNLDMDLVSIVLVTDPFASGAQDTLKQSFDDVSWFKDHYIVDLNRALEENVSKSNRATARRALRKVEVRLLQDPEEYIDDWLELYAGMIRKQNLTGFRQFSRSSFIKQFRTPGARVFEARINGNIVGMDMIYVDNGVAYGHLCGFNDEGYKMRASYATRWRILEYLKDRVQYLDFGGSAGTRTNGEADSLAEYKRRWCAMTKPVYLCSTVRDRATYDRLSQRHAESASTEYFPSYRRGEF